MQIVYHLLVLGNVRKNIDSNLEATSLATTPAKSHSINDLKRFPGKINVLVPRYLVPARNVSDKPHAKNKRF